MMDPVSIGIGVAGLVGGLGATALLSRKNKQQQSGFNAMQGYAPAVLPVQSVPTAPVDVAETEKGVTNNRLMEEERLREQQAAAARKQKSQGVLTSGLGASGVANTVRKGLLGG